QKALSFDPVERYADAGEMLAALDGAIRGIAEAPLEPYAGPVAAPSGVEEGRTEPAAEQEEDRTLVAGGPGGPAAPGAPQVDRTRVMDEEDHTLVAPPPPEARAGASPAGRRADGAPPRAFPPRPPLQERRSRAPIVWSL